MSIATVAVLRGGFFSLKPAATRVTKGRSAEEVEWLERKPCCDGERFREALKWGRRHLSRIFEAGQRREIG